MHSAHTKFSIIIWKIFFGYSCPLHMKFHFFTLKYSHRKDRHREILNRTKSHQFCCQKRKLTSCKVCILHDEMYLLSFLCQLLSRKLRQKVWYLFKNIPNDNIVFLNCGQNALPEGHSTQLNVKRAFINIQKHSDRSKKMISRCMYHNDGLKIGPRGRAAGLRHHNWKPWT